jgi:hypothetical protein
MVLTLESGASPRPRARNQALHERLRAKRVEANGKASHDAALRA